MTDKKRTNTNIKVKKWIWKDFKSAANINREAKSVAMESAMADYIEKTLGRKTTPPKTD